MAECFLPKDKLPDCWNDEARVNVLFAPFRDKSVNPKDWDTKLEFWKNVIYLYCTHNKVFVFTYQELSKIFKKDGRSPACLAVVIEQMHISGEIKPLHIFEQKPSETWRGWVTDTFLKKPVMWSFTKLKDRVITPDTNVTYVHINAVDSEANKLLDEIPASMKDKVIDLKSLAEFLKYNNVEQLNILLHSLLCKGKLSIKLLQNRNDPITLLKFHDANKSRGISDRDIDIYTLEQSEKTLSDDIEKLEKQVSTLINDAKIYLSKKQRQSAKACLRKKKEVEKYIDKRANTLHNIQILLSRVKDADSDSEVLNSYKTALASLRTTFSETGLSEESVSNTMLELEEVLEIHDDIQASLSRGNTTVDSDIESELAAILEVETKLQDKKPDVNITVKEVENEFSKLNIKLPSPPKTDLSQTKVVL